MIERNVLAIQFPINFKGYGQVHVPAMCFKKRCCLDKPPLDSASCQISTIGSDRPNDSMQYLTAAPSLPSGISENVCIPAIDLSRYAVARGSDPP